eukprot:COSAG02_NODE_1610_length_11681_cov_11.455103_9_plen_110_part_00
MPELIRELSRRDECPAWFSRSSFSKKCIKSFSSETRVPSDLIITFGGLQRHRHGPIDAIGTPSKIKFSIAFISHSRKGIPDTFERAQINPMTVVMGHRYSAAWNRATTL